MIQILYREPGTMTLFETDSPALAVSTVAGLSDSPGVTILSVDYSDDLAYAFEAEDFYADDPHAKDAA